AAPPQPPTPATPSSKEELRRTRSSPLVRKIAEEHGVDLEEIEGTGIGGRITKNDILSFVENRGASPAAAPPAVPGGQPAAAAPQAAPSAPQAAPAQPPAPAAPAAPARPPQPLKVPAGVPAEVGPPPFAEGDRYEIEPMSAMRKRIAERMIESQNISAHVTSFMEVDYTKTARVR